MLTNQYSSPTSTSKRKRDVFDFSANIDIARSVENDSHKKPRNINFDSMKSLNLDNPSPFSSPHASPFKPSNFNSPFKPNNFNSPFKPNNSNSSFKNPITSHPLNAPHTSPFKGVSTGFYSFDDNKLLEWIPKSKRKLHLSSSKCDKIFTKEDLRTILENAIKETRHNHSILCDKELQARLEEQQGTFEKIVSKDNNHTINNSHNRNFDYMS